MFTSSLFVLFLISSVSADDDCGKDKSSIAYVRLKKDVLCNYDPTIRPVVSHKTAVKVVMRMILKYFIYEMHDSSFTLENWMFLMWKDEHLKWDPSKYESITQIHLSSSEIWMPDISVYNRRNQGGDPTVVDSATCIVYNTGKVVCVPSTSQTSLCVPDLTKFPFDTQNCTVRFGSWVHSGEELDIQLLSPAVTTEDMIQNGLWEMVDSKVIKHPGKFKCCPNNTYPSVNFSFKLRRMIAAHAASIILPAIALIVLTLSSLWVSPDLPERLYLCCVNVISEFLYVQYVSWSLPLHGDKTPLILLFARDSLLLSTFTVVFSIILKKMVDKDKPAPTWLSNTVSILIATKPGQFVFLNDSSAKNIAAEKGEDDGAAIMNTQTTNSASREWVTFARILDRLCFFIYTILYGLMLISLTP